VRQVGWICAAAQGIEVKDRGQVPAELGWSSSSGDLKDAVGGRLSGFGLQYALFCRDEESAGINRHGGGDGRALRRRASDPRRP